uniref:Uncharacterized protein n=1 Tax=Anguilla anguilla TaxID=7936 RepID=A0A0E9TXZ7_ANGAN
MFVIRPREQKALTV